MPLALICLGRTFRANREAQTVGWISRHKSSRLPVEAELFFLTSLFIELIEEIVSDNAVIANLVEDSARARNPKSLCTGILVTFSTYRTDGGGVASMKTDLTVCRKRHFPCMRFSTMGPTLGLCSVRKRSQQRSTTVKI